MAIWIRVKVMGVERWLGFGYIGDKQSMREREELRVVFKVLGLRNWEVSVVFSQVGEVYGRSQCYEDREGLNMFRLSYLCDIKVEMLGKQGSLELEEIGKLEMFGWYLKLCIERVYLFRE